MPPSATTNQEVLYALAKGTGGFPIFDTNDLEGGLGKITDELNEYYVLGYTPPAKSAEGACHTIKVTVERGLEVRYRSGYCDVRSNDMLAGQEEGKTLEQAAASPSPGKIPVSLKAPYFFTGPNTARIDLALNVPGSSLSFDKEKKGHFHSDVSVLGIAYREDGSVGARFSDTQKLDLDKEQKKEFEKQPFIYRNSFDLAPGKYNLKVVLSAGGETYGKYEMPLAIEPFTGKQFALSGVAMSDNIQKVAEGATNMDAEIIQGMMPLVVNGVQIIPSSTNHFSHSDQTVAFYLEVYEPAPIVNDWPRVGITYKVIDKKTNQPVFTSPTTLVNGMVRKGNPLIPVAMKVPVDKMTAGSYRLEVQARDSNQNASPVHSAEFDLE